MPPGSAGPVGYPDYQRAENWDPGELLYGLTGAQAGQVRVSGLQVSQYASLGLWARLSAGQAELSFKWGADQALSAVTGTAQIMLDSNVGSGWQGIVPNLGAWLQITHTPAAGSPNFTPNSQFILTNRSASGSSLLSGGYLYTGAPNLAAGATFTDYPNQNLGCLAGIYTFGGSQGVTIELQALRVDFNYYRVSRWTVAANVDDYRTIVLPAHAVKVLYTNTSATTANSTSLVKICAQPTIV